MIGCDQDITCNSSEICEGLFWVEDDQIALNAVGSPPVSCSQAENLLSRVAENERIFSIIHTLLSDLIPQTLAFPIGSTDLDNLVQIPKLVQSLDYHSNLLSFHDYCGQDSVLRKWGVSIEIMIATIHNMGGLTRLYPESIDFVLLSTDLIQTFEALLSQESPCNLLVRTIPTAQILELADRSGIPPVGDITTLEELLHALDAASVDEIAVLCEHHALRIIEKCMNEVDKSHLLTHAAYTCRSWLPIALRTKITEQVFLSTVGYVYDQDYPVSIELDQGQDGRSFFDDTRIALADYDKADFALRQLDVEFFDSGSTGAGVVRSWLSRVTRYIFNPEFGYFETTDDRDLFYRPAQNPSGDLPQSRLDTYRQIGRVLGLCWKYHQSIGVTLSHTLVGFLSMTNITSKDAATWLQAEERTTFASLNNPRLIIQAQIFFNEDDPSDTTLVDQTNVVQYIARQLWMKTIGVIEPQLVHISLGFNDVVPYPTLGLFTIQEIQNRFLGERIVDRQALQNTTSYLFDSSLLPTDTNRTVSWIWEIIHSLNETEMSDFLEFVSGSPLPPTNGFASYEHWMQIQMVPSQNALPTSHTCFKTILFGIYDSIEVLRDRLVFAITNTKTITLQ